MTLSSLKTWWLQIQCNHTLAQELDHPEFITVDGESFTLWFCKVCGKIKKLK